MDTALRIAFTLVPIVSIVAYTPQIWRLYKDPARGLSLSLLTWSVWSATGIVSVLYAWVVVHDTLLLIAFAANATGQVTVTGFAVYARVHARQEAATPVEGT